MARIFIPINIKKFFELFEKIYSKHKKDGKESHLNSLFDMDSLNSKAIKANDYHEKALAASRQKEKFNKLRNTELKLLKKEISRMRAYLLTLHPNNPRNLKEWGFRVDEKKNIKAKEDIDNKLTGRFKFF